MVKKRQVQTRETVITKTLDNMTPVELAKMQRQISQLLNDAHYPEGKKLVGNPPLPVHANGELSLNDLKNWKETAIAEVNLWWTNRTRRIIDLCFRLSRLALMIADIDTIAVTNVKLLTDDHAGNLAKLYTEVVLASERLDIPPPERFQEMVSARANAIRLFLNSNDSSALREASANSGSLQRAILEWQDSLNTAGRPSGTIQTDTIIIGKRGLELVESGMGYDQAAEIIIKELKTAAEKSQETEARKALEKRDRGELRNDYLRQKIKAFKRHKEIWGGD